MEKLYHFFLLSNLTMNFKEGTIVEGKESHWKLGQLKNLTVHFVTVKEKNVDGMWDSVSLTSKNFIPTTLIVRLRVNISNQV